MKRYWMVAIVLLIGMMIPTVAADTCYDTITAVPASCSGSITSDTASGTCRTVECSDGSGSIRAAACEKTDGGGRYFEIYRNAATGTAPEVCFGNDCLRTGWGYERGDYFPICMDGSDPGDPGDPSDPGDPGADSSLRLVSGTVNGQAISPGDRTITVSPGDEITGGITLNAESAWSSDLTQPLISTPSWGAHQSSHQWHGNATDKTVSVSATAPTIEGTYHIIFAYRAEIDGADVASLTNWAANPEVWNDGNDIASWSTSMINIANSDGRVQAPVLYNDGYMDRYVPATAITVIVDDGGTNQPPYAGITDASPTSGPAPLTVEFDGSDSGDPDGDPITYSWTFGDGGTSSEPSPTHTYMNEGVYSATLCVNDGQATDCESIHIQVEGEAGSDDPGANSALHLISGTINGQAVSSNDRAVEVAPGASIAGSVTMDVDNFGWSSDVNVPFISTPTWGDHATSFNAHGEGEGDTKTVSISETAPSTPGEYWIVFAYRAEVAHADVASMTNWVRNPEVWNDGNDIAGWSDVMIETANSNGRTQGSVLFEDHYEPRAVPATAVKIIVSDGGTSGAICGNNVVEQGETCDDGNTAGGDGCSATCQEEDAGGACYESIGELPVTCDGSITSDSTSGTCRTAECQAPSGSIRAMACEKTDSNGKYFEIYRQSATGTAPEICFGNDCLQPGWGYERGEEFPVCMDDGDTGGGTCTPSQEVCDATDNDCDALVDEGDVCGGGTGDDDPGEQSSLTLVSGNVNGQGISSSSRTVTVDPGESISGTVSLSHNSAWPTSISTPLGYTPTWGSHQASYEHLAEVDGTGTKTVSVSETAPAAPGTYHLIFAYRGEVDAGDVFSATNWDYDGGNQWNDGNDIASWSTTMIDTANSNGRVEASWLYNQGYLQRSVPATAITIVVEDSGSGAVCGNTVVEQGEVCDDGNTQNGDGCSSTCQIEGGGNTCYERVNDIPATCTGTITNDAASGTCRTIECASGSGSIKVFACDKPDSGAKQYFEMYRQSATGTTPEVCIGETCIQHSGYARSDQYPICVSGTTIGEDNENGNGNESSGNANDVLQLRLYDAPGVPFSASTGQKRDAPTTSLSGAVDFDEYNVDHEVVKAQIQYDFAEPLSADHTVSFTWMNSDTGNSGSPPHLTIPEGTVGEYNVFGTIGKKTFGAGEIDRPGAYEAQFDLQGPDVQSSDSVSFTVEGTMPDCEWCGTGDADEAPGAAVTISLDPLFPADNNAVFHCEADGFEPTSYTFDFGDGSFETRPVSDIYHTYAEEGSYEITCTATDGTNTASDSMTVDITTPLAPRPLDRTHLEAVVSVEVLEDRTVEVTCNPVGFRKNETDYWQLFGDGDNHGYVHPGAISTTSGGGSGNLLQFRYDTPHTITNVFPNAGDYYVHCANYVEEARYHPDYYDYTKETYHNVDCGPHRACQSGNNAATFTIPEYEVDYPIGDECTSTTGTEYVCTGTNETCFFDEIDPDGWTVGSWEGGSRTCEEGYWYPTSYWE